MHVSLIAAWSFTEALRNSTARMLAVLAVCDVVYTHKMTLIVLKWQMINGAVYRYSLILLCVACSLTHLFSPLRSKQAEGLPRLRPCDNINVSRQVHTFTPCLSHNNNFVLILNYPNLITYIMAFATKRKLNKISLIIFPSCIFPKHLYLSH